VNNPHCRRFVVELAVAFHLRHVSAPHELTISLCLAISREAARLAQDLSGVELVTLPAQNVSLSKVL
jgi:hypothetical protein